MVWARAVGRYRIGMLNQLRGGQEGVIWRGDNVVIFARQDRSDKSVGAGQLVSYRPQQVRTEPGAGAATERMHHREALQRVAASGGPAHCIDEDFAVDRPVHLMAVRPVVPGPRDVGDDLLAVEEVAQRPTQCRSHDPFFHIDEDCARTKRTRVGAPLCVIHVGEVCGERLVEHPEAVVKDVLAKDEIPETAAYLVAALADLNGHDLTHEKRAVCLH